MESWNVYTRNRSTTILIELGEIMLCLPKDLVEGTFYILGAPCLDGFNLTF